MGKFLILSFLFFIGCVLGWGLEVFYRRFKKSNPNKIWYNPGFLIGPYLPLYGFGLCLLYLMASLENTELISHVTVGSKLGLFVVMALGMTLLEYIAGLIFIKGMNLKLWDYSDEWGNLQGIICPRFSFFWALLGAVYYFLIHPHIIDALSWFADNLAFSFVVGCFFGVFAVDLCYSFSLAGKIRKFAVENKILIRYELLKQEFREGAAARAEKIGFMMPFKSQTPLHEHLKRYIDLYLALGPYVDGFEELGLLEKKKGDPNN